MTQRHRDLPNRRSTLIEEHAGSNICAQWIDLPDSCSRTYHPDLAEWIVPLEPRHIMAGAPQDLLMQGHERAAVPGLIGTAWFRRRLK
jgi:hypothetical protein